MEIQDQAMDEQAAAVDVVEPLSASQEMHEDGRAAEQAKHQKALDELKKALTADPRNIDLLIALGRTAEASGDLDRARWAYKRAIRLDPQTATAHLELGRLYMAGGRIKPAIEALQNCLRYSADDAERRQAMNGLRLLLNQDSERLEKICEEAPGCNALTEAWQQLGLTPAEALFLMDPDNSSGQQMMRYTLLDLAIRKILEVTANYQVGRGEHYGDATLEPHEALFAKYFAHFSDYVDLDRLSSAALSELNSRSDLFKEQYVLQSLVEKGFVEKETQRKWGLVPVSRYLLSPKGVRARNQLKRLLKQTDGQIVRSLKSNPEQARAYLSAGGPPVLLIEDFPPTYFEEWQETLERMGFGPALDRLRFQVQQPTRSEFVNEIIEALLGGKSR